MKESIRNKKNVWVSKSTRCYFLSSLLIVVILLTGCSRDSAKSDMPEDFSFSYVWGANGNSSYDSTTGKLIKDRMANTEKKFETTLKLNKEELNEIWEQLSDIDISGYPTYYNPKPDVHSEPSMTIELRISYGDVQKLVACRNICYSYQSGDEKGQKFLSLCKMIEDMIIATDEWKELPEYENYYL